MASITLEFPRQLLLDLDKRMAGLQTVNFTGPIRAAAMVLMRAWQERLPMPGLPGHDRVTGRLRASMNVKVKWVKHRGVIYAVIGADRAKDEHARVLHLVEESHRITSHRKDTGKKTKAAHYGKAAEGATRGERYRVLREGLTKSIDRAMKKKGG